MKKDSRKQFEKNLPLQYEAVFDYESNDCNFSSRSHSYDFAKNNLFFGKKTCPTRHNFSLFRSKTRDLFFFMSRLILSSRPFQLNLRPFRQNLKILFHQFSTPRQRQTKVLALRLINNRKNAINKPQSLLIAKIPSRKRPLTVSQKGNPKNKFKFIIRKLLIQRS